MSDKKYTTLENMIRKVVAEADENRNTELRRKIKNVARPDDPAPNEQGQKLTKQAEIKNKIIDEAEEKKVKLEGGKTEVDLKPTTDDRSDTDTQENADSKKARAALKKQVKEEAEELEELAPLAVAGGSALVGMGARYLAKQTARKAAQDLAKKAIKPNAFEKPPEPANINTPREVGKSNIPTVKPTPKSTKGLDNLKGAGEGPEIKVDDKSSDKPVILPKSKTSPAVKASVAASGAQQAGQSQRFRPMPEPSKEPESDNKPVVLPKTNVSPSVKPSIDVSNAAKAAQAQRFRPMSEPEPKPEPKIDPERKVMPPEPPIKRSPPPPPPPPVKTKPEPKPAPAAKEPEKKVYYSEPEDGGVVKAWGRSDKAPDLPGMKVTSPEGGMQDTKKNRAIKGTQFEGKESPMFKSDKTFGTPEALLDAVKEILEAKHKSEKEKDLAAMGHPKDKITKKDVLIARGVLAKEDMFTGAVTDTKTGKKVVSPAATKADEKKPAANVPLPPKRPDDLKKEEFEQIDEISAAKAGSYMAKATKSRENAEDEREYYKSHGDNTDQENRIIAKRKAGMNMAMKKLTGKAKVNTREEVELSAEELARLDEISKGFE